MNKPCPFCSLPASRILGGDELALIASDGFPVAKHTTKHIMKHVLSRERRKIPEALICRMRGVR